MRVQGVPERSGQIDRHLEKWTTDSNLSRSTGGVFAERNGPYAKNLTRMPNRMTPRLKDFLAMAHRCPKELILAWRPPGFGRAISIPQGLAQTNLRVGDHPPTGQGKHFAVTRGLD